MVHHQYKKKPSRHRQVSFTGKEGQILPGAAVGYSPESRRDTRRHSTGAVGTGQEYVHHQAYGYSSLSSKETAFEERMEAIGLHIVQVEADGNCLFRALANQIYCDENRHKELRLQCIEHMLENRDRYEIFCTFEFDSYIARMQVGGTWAGELEIRAMEEVLDRVIFIYSSDNKDAKPMPMNTNFDEALIVGLDIEPVKLSYHSGCHYNSVYDQKCQFPLPVRTSTKLRDARIRLLNSNEQRETKPE